MKVFLPRDIHKIVVGMYVGVKTKKTYHEFPINKINHNLIEFEDEDLHIIAYFNEKKPLVVEIL